MKSEKKGLVRHRAGRAYGLNRTYHSSCAARLPCSHINDQAEILKGYARSEVRGPVRYEYRIADGNMPLL